MSFAPNLKKGDEIESLKISTITKEQLREYSLASGDPNEIHLDDDAAKKAGLPGVIAHGMLIAAFVAERGLRVLESELNEDWKLARLKTRFSSMTLPGNEISVGGRILAVENEKITIELKAWDQKGEAKIVGQMEFKKKNEGKN